VKKLLVLVAVALMVVAASCETKNMGGPLPSWGPIVTVTVPAGMNGGLPATWTVTWASGTGPFTISMNMGGGTTANVAAGTPGVSPFTQVFTMVNPSTIDTAPYSYTVVVTDSQGLSGTATGAYNVGPTLNADPTVSAVYAEPVLTVTVNDVDDLNTFTVDVTVPAGLAVDDTSKVPSATGPVVATFNWSATDFVLGGTGTTTVTVTDQDGGTATTDVLITIAAFPLAADTLYGIPSPTAAAVGDTITVLVLTGIPANALQFVNGIGLTIDSDCDKVANTFNIGVLGGGNGDADGFWTAMNPGGGFLLPPDNFIVATDIGGGRERWDFNVTPIGGADQTTASGALFNYQFTFGSAGTKTFGFQEISGVKRTYYSDGASTEFFWGDITNAAAPTVGIS